ncbi:E3 ubiquitin-protein [Vigna angularis]|uniref:HECT-type E3 ubiquitin transferase n=1 Tax=Phaseolus angularis TaxID=3914 RepID=A0A8T0KBV9_PHAAN|nr:E3 ubiquitin-protein [Vigna angularis]
MLKTPRFIDFDNKRFHFRSKIKHQHDHHHSPLRISVRRAYVLEDSYNQLRMRSTQDLKGRLTVHFQGEEGIDAGGLTREWYQLLSRVIFDRGALLFTTVGNESTFQPNPNSVYQTEHLSYFKFVGRVVGKALFDGQLLDVHLTSVDRFTCPSPQLIGTFVGAYSLDVTLSIFLDALNNNYVALFAVFCVVINASLNNRGVGTITLKLTIDGSDGCTEPLVYDRLHVLHPVPQCCLERHYNIVRHCFRSAQLIEVVGLSC